MLNNLTTREDDLNLLAREIANGIESYKNYRELCFNEELPEWVVAIGQTLHDGNTNRLSPHLPWVTEVYKHYHANPIQSKSDSVK